MTYCLVAQRGVRSIGKLEGIYVSDVEKELCSQFFSAPSILGIRTFHCDSPTQSAEKVSKVKSKRVHMGGVSTKEEAEKFKLKILRDDIGDKDQKTNHTESLLPKKEAA